jgi:HEAT repeat protein
MKHDTPEGKRPYKHTFEREGIQGLCEATADEDPRLRTMAGLLLERTDKTYLVEHLIRALRAGDKAERERVSRGLALAGKVAVVPLLGLLEDESWVLRYRAAEALGRIRDPRAVLPLIATLRDEKDHVRYMAAKALCRFTEGRAEEPLIVLLDDPNMYVRRMAACALAGIASDRACRALAAALSRETDPVVHQVIDDAYEKASGARQLL